MTSDADRLLSLGMPIVGVEGEERRLRFSLLAIARCEAAYGSWAATIEELSWLQGQMVLQFPEPTAARVAAMLQHVLGAADPVDAGSTPAECIEALLEAWMEAFPAPSGDPGKA
ncbi:hypothetical protein KSP35_13040 [Aquihabitans sp. G128]|uniref:hypothetical protein n=1 Tax=Aquihabitans sp. G128 TaxID=2849779 RepID=UPI001C232732|nr:hypothetical protein [Aquihabitans sp. G128]QXC59328.1 hypothetical protein KSP35_13040 [Aquihabitans sp. G128]